MDQVGCAVQAACGGCPLLSLNQLDELETKDAMVSSKLSDVGIAISVNANSTRDPPTWQSRFAYRNRLRMQVIDGRVRFFNEVKRNGCPVVRPDLWAAVQHLIAITAAAPAMLGAARHLEVRVGDDGSPAVAVPFQIDLRSFSERLGPDWLVADSTTTRPPNLAYNFADGLTVNVPITSFVQVNSAVNRQLVGSVLSTAGEVGARSFLDLFSGAGNFSITLAEQGLDGTAVDNVGDAIAELGRTEFVKSGRLKVIQGDARQLLPRLSAVDLLIANPPRAGLQMGYSLLVQLVNRKMILVGCNASSFSTDVAELCAAGLVLESVTTFDMFPGTNHVESLAVLSR